MSDRPKPPSRFFRSLLPPAELEEYEAALERYKQARAAARRRMPVRSALASTAITAAGGFLVGVSMAPSPPAASAAIVRLDSSSITVPFPTLATTTTTSTSTTTTSTIPPDTPIGVAVIGGREIAVRNDATLENLAAGAVVVDGEIGLDGRAVLAVYGSTPLIGDRVEVLGVHFTAYRLGVASSIHELISQPHVADVELAIYDSAGDGGPITVTYLRSN